MVVSDGVPGEDVSINSACSSEMTFGSRLPWDFWGLLRGLLRGLRRSTTGAFFFGLVDGKRTSRLDPGNLGLAVVLGLFTLGAWALLGFGVLAKLRHPVVRVSP